MADRARGVRRHQFQGFCCPLPLEVNGEGVRVPAWGVCVARISEGGRMGTRSHTRLFFGRGRLLRPAGRNMRFARDVREW